MWVALPMTALRFWQAWDRLPARMATHFDAKWQPNGWMSRESALWFAIGITAFMLVVFTAILVFMYFQKSPGALAGTMLAFSYAVVGFVYYINISVVERNLNGAPIRLSRAMMLLVVAAIVLTIAFLRSHRGQPLENPVWTASETHASALWALVFLIPLALELALLVTAKGTGVRVVLAFLSALFVLVTLFAWKGFTYFFGPAGVEIRTLGIRLRSIPLRHILHYEAAKWNPLRGYGIRGLGRSRAYVWGNEGVRIHTTDGEVFLGHRTPQKILHDLDAIRQVAR
jgi:hypothetical protein